MVCAACGDGKTSLPAACRDGGCPPEVTLIGTFQAALDRDVDILIVVDDTPVLSSQAEALAAGFLKVGKFLTPTGGLPPDLVPSVRVAVVPGSLAAAASAAPASRAAGCGIVPPGQYLETGKCGRAPNTSRPVEETFACLSALGHDRVAPFEPFAAVKRALGPDGLADFLRPTASLLVFIVAGQDDASSVEVTDLEAFLTRLKPEANKLLVSVAGPPTSCPDGGTAPPPSRLLDLVHATGRTGVYSTLCGDNALLIGLQNLAISRGAVRFGCLPRMFDTDPSVTGLQPDCVATDLTYPRGVDGPVETPLPACEHGAPPCWKVNGSTPRCALGLVEFEIDRGPDWCLQEGFETRVSCLLCNGANDPGCKSY
jgi:hypothetical protein